MTAVGPCSASICLQDPFDLMSVDYESSREAHKEVT